MQLAFAVFKYFRFGGMQRNMLAIAQACVERGHRVTIFTGNWEGDHPSGIAVKELAVSGLSNHRRNASFAEALAEQLVLQPMDLVVGFNRMPGLDIYYAGDSCFAAKAYQDRSFLYRLTSRCRSSLAFERAVFSSQQSTDILLVSSAERAAFEQYYQTQAERFYAMPPGISRRCIAPDNAERLRTDTRRQLKVTDDEVLLLALGSGFKTKGLDRSIELLAALVKQRKARLLVVGQDKSAAFIAQAKRLGVADCVEFVGGRDDVPAILQAADLLLHPAYRENTGNVLIEAMVAGLPVIASRVCGYAHYIEDAEMGAVVEEPFDQAVFLSSVETVLSKPRADWQQRGKQFANTADVYSRPERAADAIETIAARRGLL